MRADAYVGLPPSLPLPALVQTAFMWRSPFTFLDRLRARYGNRFTVHALARQPLIFFADLSDAKAIFRAPPDILLPGRGGAVIEPIVGPRSFLIADAEPHSRRRAALAHSFSDEAVQADEPAVRRIAEREIASWTRGTPIALHDRLRVLTLRVILHTLFGSDLAMVPRLHSTILSMLSVTEGTSLTLPRARSVPPNRSAWRQFLLDRRSVDTMLLSLIDSRRSALRLGSDALGALLAARDEHGAPLSAADIRDNLMSLILAGHETTAGQLSWAFQLLAHNPDVQNELISDIAAGGDRYLAATVRETLRHRPVFLFGIPRAVDAPFALGELMFRPGVDLLACSYLIQHDPHAFPRPHEFCPHRFLDDVPGPSWIPWGGGRRRCPGRRLALLEIETVLRVVLSNLRVHRASSAPERPRWRTVIVTPHAGSRVILTEHNARPPEPRVPAGALP